MTVLRNATCASVLVLLCATLTLSQSRTMYVGDVELRLGMSQDAVMKLLSKYKLTVTGNSLMVSQYDQARKRHDALGHITFEEERLTYISRYIDTSAWPTDEGFSIARAIYDSLNGSISRTDSDGSKRASAQIVISNQDSSTPTPINIRTIYIYVEGRKIIILISDSAEGKSVGAQVDISSKPW
jgi:hypothetical protein